MQFADERNILRIGHAAVFYYGAIFAVVGSIALFLLIPGKHDRQKAATAK